MGFSFSVGLPGPFRYSRSLGRSRRRRRRPGFTAGILGLFAAFCIWAFRAAWFTIIWVMASLYWLGLLAVAAFQRPYATPRFPLRTIRR